MAEWVNGATAQPRSTTYHGRVRLPSLQHGICVSDKWGTKAVVSLSESRDNMVARTPPQEYLVQLAQDGTPREISPSSGDCVRLSASDRLHLSVSIRSCFASKKARGKGSATIGDLRLLFRGLSPTKSLPRQTSWKMSSPAWTTLSIFLMSAWPHFSLPRIR